ncbi:Importin alpha subunit (Karyopherin alpha subunit) (Serine-rich RNA polymerase I suppressor protein), partial [Podochytrium sp. JEL0797]
YEACWVLTNIAAGKPTHTSAVVDSGFIPSLITLLSAENDQVRVQAAWALGNIAGDNKEYTQLLLDGGIMAPLLEIPYYHCLSQRKSVQARHVVCWVIANLCRWDNKDWVQIEPAFAVITDTIMKCHSPEVLSEAIWALSRIFHAKHPGNSRLVNVNLIRKLVLLIQNKNAAIQTPVLRVMTNVSGDQEASHTQVLIDAGILESIHTMLCLRGLHNSQVIVEVLHCLSNITAGTTSQKEAVRKAGLFGPVREALLYGDAKVKREACHVLRNTVDRDATPEHFREVVGPQGEIFEPLTQFLVSTSTQLDMHLQIIETLNIIFSRGNEPQIRALYPFAVPGTNVYVTCMNYVSQQNFRNIWNAYKCVMVTPDDDLEPLMRQCMMTEREVQQRGDLDEASKKGVVDYVVGHFKPGFTSAEFVRTEKLKKAVARDFGVMMDVYLFEQRRVEIEGMDEMDLVAANMTNLAVSLRGGE